MKQINLLYISGKMRFNSLSEYLQSRLRPFIVVRIATGYRLDNQGVGVRVPVAERIFTSSRRLGRLWGPPNLLSNVYRGKAAEA
jgi:hypothetical protein